MIRTIEENYMHAHGQIVKLDLTVTGLMEHIYSFFGWPSRVQLTMQHKSLPAAKRLGILFAQGLRLLDTSVGPLKSWVPRFARSRETVSDWGKAECPGGVK